MTSACHSRSHFSCSAIRKRSARCVGAKSRRRSSNANVLSKEENVEEEEGSVDANDVDVCESAGVVSDAGRGDDVVVAAVAGKHTQSRAMVGSFVVHNSRGFMPSSHVLSSNTFALLSAFSGSQQPPLAGTSALL